jgi:hypothetical protein
MANSHFGNHYENKFLKVGRFLGGEKHALKNHDLSLITTNQPQKHHHKTHTFPKTTLKNTGKPLVLPRSQAQNFF